MIKILTIAEFLLLVLGITLPLATIDEFWFFSSEFSIISLTQNLVANGEYTLGFVIITFCIFFPFLKMLNRIVPVKAIETFSLHKFAMVDIFLLSFLIFGGKLSYFYQVNLQVGFYCLLASIFLSYFFLLIKTYLVSSH